MKKALFALPMAATSEDPSLTCGYLDGGGEMPAIKDIELKELSIPRTRRVFEAVRMLGENLSDLEDDSLPVMPPGVLMKSRKDGGGWHRE